MMKRLLALQILLVVGATACETKFDESGTPVASQVVFDDPPKPAQPVPGPADAPKDAQEIACNDECRETCSSSQYRSVEEACVEAWKNGCFQKPRKVEPAKCRMPEAAAAPIGGVAKSDDDHAGGEEKPTEAPGALPVLFGD